uniref:Mannosyl-glycoprotein endo-beta-N-acetylglucosamidase-like domain-containing protein n=1 Tax=viral metagenome TaxID=1070528 RepID=A0A6M3LX10_9ZZZZ
MILLAVFLIYETILQNREFRPNEYFGEISTSRCRGNGKECQGVTRVAPSLSLWQGSKETNGENTQDQGSTDNINGLRETESGVVRKPLLRGGPEYRIQDGYNATNNATNNGQETRTAETIDRFLKEYGSPLAGGGGEIVSIAEGFDIDSLLLVAISVIESGACREPIGGNCLGFGSYTFNDVYLDGFYAVAEALSGEGENGRYYKKCQKLDNGSTQQHECLLRIYNSENPEYAETVLRQRDFIKEFK